MHLAGDGAEERGFLQVSIAGDADAAGRSGRPCLRPLVQENHFCAVCCICLHKILLNFGKICN